MQPEILDRLPPQDVDAERAVLGSLLLDPAKCDDVGPIVRVDDFYAEAHRKLYGHLMAMRDAGDAIDVATVVDRLRTHKDLEAVGGTAEIAKLYHSIPVAANAVYYAKIVARKAARRRLIQTGCELIQTAYEEGEDPEQVVDRAEKLLHDAWRGEHHRAPKAVKDVVQDVTIEIDEIQQRKRVVGHLTGLETWDRNHGGLFAGELIIVASRPGVGKTSLGCQIAWHFATHDRPVYFVSLEMAARQLVLRVLCSQAGVSSKLVRIGSLTSSQTDRLVEASHPLARAPWWIHDAPQMTCSEIRRTARRLHRHGLKLIVIDYLQRIEPRDRRINRYEQVGEMSGALKALALELNVPILCLTQLNREIEKDAKPRLSHLRESGSIEQDADVVAFLRWLEDEKADPSEAISAELKILKNRNGETGTIPLLWVPSRTLFECGGAWT